MTQTIVFDLGGVLIDWDPRRLYRKLLPDETAIDRFLQTVCTSEWNAQQDAGQPFAEGVAQLSGRWPEHAGLIEAYHTRWIEMIGGPMPETVAILGALRERRFPLYALTNWSTETFPLVRDQYDFLNWFAGIVVSGEEKLIKPHPSIFRLLLDRYDLTPDQTVFIDDSPANVEAARKLGIDAIPFTCASALRQALIDREILPAEG
jgi:2-haloacid dehalogenase